MNKIVISVCPLANLCLVDVVTPVECWWRRCENCFGVCPLFEGCKENLRVSAEFWVLKNSENPKFCNYEQAIALSEMPAGRWKLKRWGLPVYSTSLIRRFPTI